MSDKDPRAARAFFRDILKFAETTKPWETHISYETKPDERFDLSLVSQRVYGRRDEYLCIMAAAELDTVDQPLIQKRLVLPTESQLLAIKRRNGFESIAAYRKDNAPTWA